MPITLEQLCNLLNPTKTALLLGAGASVPSGAPTGMGLARKLWKVVANSESQSDDLVETASIIERRFGRKALVDAVSDDLRRLKPTGGLLGLPTFPWKEIFTTNFDQLVDEAVTYAETAHLAAILIDESVERLDSVRLKPMIDAIKQNSRSWNRDYALAQEKLGSSFDEVGEPRVIYMH
jgi:hypothetical protein